MESADHNLGRINRLGLGALSTIITQPIRGGISFVGQKLGYLPSLEDTATLYKESLMKQGSTLNNDLLANAECFWEETARQLNELNPGKNITPFQLKMIKGKEYFVISITNPIIEELVFRFLIQDVLLKRIPKYIVKTIAPGKEVALDSRLAAITRIFITASLFSSVHILGKTMEADAYVINQLATSFIGGILYGTLKESKVGLLGSIGAHITYNMMGRFSSLLKC